MMANWIRFFSVVFAVFCLCAFSGCASGDPGITEEHGPDVRKIAVLVGGAPDGDIYQKMVQCTRKKNPVVLLFCTGWNDSPERIREELANFASLTNQAEAIRLSEEDLTEKILAEKIRKADLIYVAGGNAQMIFRKFQDFSLGTLFENAYNRGAVLAGNGPGAAVLCYSGYNFFRHGRLNLRKGMAILPFHFCYEYQRPARRNFDHRLSWEKYPARGFALTAGTALFCIDDEYMLYKFAPDAQAFQFILSDRFWRKSELKTRKEVAAEAAAEAQKAQ